MINIIWLLIIVGIGGVIFSAIFSVLVLLKSSQLQSYRTKKNPEILNTSASSGWHSFAALRYLNSDEDNEDPQILKMKLAIKKFYEKATVSMVVSISSVIFLVLIAYLVNNAQNK